MVTLSAPHVFPMHCAIAINQELVSHRQLEVRQRQEVELEVEDVQKQALARLHAWVS
jgi:hypothetical protein